MTEAPLQRVIDEDEFVGILEQESEEFFGFVNKLVARADKPWGTKHYYELVHQANELESLLDDYGARYNRSFHLLTELVASVRGFGQAGYSLAHMSGRLPSYRTDESLPAEVHERLLDATERVIRFVRRSLEGMFEGIRSEARDAGVAVRSGNSAEAPTQPVALQRKLPRNVGVEDLAEEETRIAEVTSKFVLAHEMLARIKVRTISDELDRRKFLEMTCTEEQARVYEATVHNLQSAYDTYIQNTKLEHEDERLSLLRGLTSTALHLLEAVTFLTHFYERHESDLRSEAAKEHIASIVDRGLVQDAVLNYLLRSAVEVMTAGKGIAESLLAKYTNAQELQVELGSDLVLHARPAALIVGVVNHYGTPVELEVRGQKCNAASILELLLTVGSHPDEKSFTFRGDANPLRDIRMLFEHDLGEQGIDMLPESLAYLRNS